MSTIQVLSELRQSIETTADPETRAKLSRLVPGARVVGVTVPQLRSLVIAFRRKHKFSLAEACELMDKSCQGRVREEILFGIFLLGGYGKRLTSLKWGRIENWIEALDNWETCDQLAINVSGPMVASNLEYVDELVKLAGAANPWRRRFAAATAAVINHKGGSHAEETFRVCRLLLADPNPMVLKAVAWAIREASKQDEAAAYTFLRANKQKMPTSLLREASEKLSSQARQRILR